jgi:cytochrome c551/c552
MVNILKIVFFSIAVWMGFVGFARFGIPLIVPEPPPVEEKLTGEITMDQFVAFGGKIFKKKGTCLLCHNPVGGRAPLLGAAASVAEERIKDENYKGIAKTGEEYLRESMLDPSAYVVKGFGKKGTNDTLSPMPVINKGAIGLSDMEIDAVIAYLQSTAGVDITVALPSGDAEVDDTEEEQVIKVAENAKEAFEKFECGACHMHPMVEEGGEVGPDLTNIAKDAGTKKKGLSAEQYIVESIIDPNAFIADTEEYDPDMMPDDLAGRMTVLELNMLVNALMGKEEKKAEGDKE